MAREWSEKSPPRGGGKRILPRSFQPYFPFPSCVLVITITAWRRKKAADVTYERSRYSYHRVIWRYDRRGNRIMLIPLRRYSFIRVTSERAISKFPFITLQLRGREREFFTFAKIVWDILFSCAFIATSSPQSLPSSPRVSSTIRGLASYRNSLRAFRKISETLRENNWFDSGRTKVRSFRWDGLSIVSG